MEKSDSRRRRWIMLLVMLIGTGSLGAQNTGPEGFAAVNAMGQNGTTGGAGGATVTVTGTAEFLDYIFRLEPYIIQVADTIELASMAPFRSHKTVVGLGDRGVITGSGLNLSSVSNIILRNLLIENSNDDAINIQEGAHHIWVDHCDLRSSFDGLLDIKRGADYITVSWNHFSQHDKTSLIGHSDNNGAQDSGHFHISYHHNWFEGTTQRHPRIRFSALSHIYNNFYDNLGSYGVGSTMDAEVLVEGNYFLNVDDPTLVGVAASGPGDLVERDNIYDNCLNGPQTRGTVPEPPYAYQADAAADIPALVSGGAGRAGYPAPNSWAVYDASVLPEDNNPPYLPENEVNPPDTAVRVLEDPDIPGNKLISFLTPDANRIMFGNNWAIDPARGATIAFRTRPVDPALYQRTIEVEFRDGILRERLFVLPGGVVELDRADVSATLPGNPDGWHTYRVTYQNGTSVVYLDEDPVPFLSGASTSTNSTNDLRFGDGSDGNTYGFYLDWFIYDTSGAYAPGERLIPDSLFVDHPVVAIGGGENPVSGDFFLAQNYPNPFNPGTTISFQLPRGLHTTLTIYNSLGQVVAVLADQFLSAGRHRFVFDGDRQTSGIYFYRLRAGDFWQTRKMMLIK